MRFFQNQYLFQITSLCLILILVANNLFISFYKKNLDWASFVYFLSFVSFAVDLFRFKSRTRRLNVSIFLFLEKIFFVTILISLTNQLTYLYSNGFDAKTLRILEYLQTIIFLLLFEWKKLKWIKRIFPFILIALSLTPPYSVMLDASFLMADHSRFNLIALFFWLLVRNRNFSALVKAYKIPVLFFIFYFFLIILSFFINGFQLSLEQALLLHCFHFFGSLTIVVLLRKESLLRRFFLIYLILFFLKICYIVFFPLNISSRGSVNNNLYGITLEFLFWLSIYFFIFSKNKVLKLLFAILSILILIAFYRLVSRSPFLAILYGLGFLFIIREVFSRIDSRMNLKIRWNYILLSFHFLFLMSLFIYLFFYSRSESILIRVKLWSLGLQGSLDSVGQFLFGNAEIGRLTLLNLVKLPNSQLDRIPMDAGMFQTHLHNEVISLLYGIGIFSVIWYLGIQFLFFRKLKISTELKLKDFFILSMIGFAFHGLTEPIITNLYTSFFVWLCFFGLYHHAPAATKSSQQAQVRLIYVQMFVSFCLVIFLFLYLTKLVNERDIVKYAFHFPQTPKIVRGMENQIDNVEKKEIEYLINFSDRMDLYNKQLSIGKKEWLADIFLRQYQVLNKNDSLARAEILLCDLFDSYQSPRNYNQLRNLLKIKNSNNSSICSTDINIKFMNYDPYGLIETSFY